MFSKKILILFLSAIPFWTVAQTSYVIPGMKEEWMLHRMDVKFSPGYLKFSSARPFSRKEAVRDVEWIDSSNQHVSKVDRYNIDRFLAANSEWSAPRASFQSKKPVLKYFYKNKANAFELKSNDFFIVFNPIVQYQQFKEQNNKENVFLNSRGLQARGVIENKIGFSFYFTENQERPPAYVNQWVNTYKAVPGVGFYKTFKNAGGYDYFDIRSSVSWSVARFLEMQLAYDKNFIGNGYRSLFLSDFSNNYMFLKLNWHFKRIRYQNIFAEMFPFQIATADKVLSRKYYRAHYLDFAATKWLNLGLFEGTMMGKDRLTIGLFNPIMYLDIPGKKNAIRDRNYLGFDLKANLFHHLQLYGQLMIDKLKTSGLKDKTWDNRFGFQAGMKYIDAFGLKNVDIQFEANRVRPYTYAANDTLTSYTHYNQPLAHPLGASFQEFIGIIKAQPLKQVYLQAKVIGYYQGLDIVNYNLGSNVFGGFNNRLSDVRVRVGDGDRGTAVYINLLGSYELKENLFVDISFTRRSYETFVVTKTTTTFVSAGIRLNMARREFEF
jgi:hypothetical protein